MRRVLLFLTALTVLALTMLPSSATFPGGKGTVAHYDFRRGRAAPSSPTRRDAGSGPLCSRPTALGSRS